jgi:hypothetical protein
MTAMETDLVNSLTQEGEFEQRWAHFMFNMTEAMQLKLAKPEEIMAVLAAGSKFAGTSWSTGKASKTLFQHSQVALVKASFTPYRDVWLYVLALMAGVDLPNLELPQECAEAAFAIASAAEEKTPKPSPSSPTILSDTRTTRT